MAEMKLEPPTDLMPEVYGWTSVFSYMRWPTDEEARKRYMLANSARWIGYVDEIRESESPGHKSPELFSVAADIVKAEVLSEYFDPAGGFAALNFPRGGDMDDWPVRQWRTTSFILSVIRSIDDHHPEVKGGASLAKAKHVADRTSSRFDLATNEKYIDGAWLSYRTVSHLCVALTDIVGFGFKFDMKGLGAFLGIAHDYQEFLLRFRPFSRPEPIVAAGAIWKVPDWCALPEMPQVCRPLPADLLDEISRYRAPK